mmetsp:Transcript_45526/g.110278  ORF Transcript_45526/g.110278 Transcript_45526/m.110278 type:complete len:324 (+) Transcript_45526:199-1170(+)
MMIAHPPVPPHEHHAPSWGHDTTTSMEEDELQDICDHVQRHSSMIPEVQAPPHLAACRDEVPVVARDEAVVQAPPPTSNQEPEVSCQDDNDVARDEVAVQAPPPTSSSNQEPEVSCQDDDDDGDAPLSEDQARFCAIKREAILLLSAAHKSTSGVDRIRAMKLLAALYKAETKHDLAILGAQVTELLQKKKKQEEEMERLRREEEANRVPERFSRIRSGFNRMMHPNQHHYHNQSDAVSVASQPCPRQARRNTENNNGGRGWRFFWQQRGGGDVNDSQYGGRRQRHSDGIHGIQRPITTTSASRNARLHSLSERRKIWDTRTI